MSETVEQAARQLLSGKIARGYVPKALHTYVNADGQPIYYRARLEHPDGDAAPHGRKIIRPLFLNGTGYKLGEPSFPDNRKPLYNLDRIAAEPDAPIFVVEGEKAADALTKAGVVATTSGGADSAGRADWAPLAGRACILWPDNDDAGRAYVGDVAAILGPLGCKLSAVNAETLGLPAKGDAYDWLSDHAGALPGDLLALQRVDARPVDQTASATEPEPSASLRVLNLADLLAYRFPERELILAPWLLTQSLSMIHAWRGTGKTHVALGIAYAIATGGTFLKWSAAKPRRVLYLDGEMPGVAMQARLQTLVDADERDFDPAFLVMLTPDAQSGAMPDLATRKGQEAISKIAEEHEAEVIIVDNISTLCRDNGPENEAESWRTPQEWALRMRRSGRSVVFIHHSGKNGKQRGSSKREDTLDTSIVLKGPADHSPDQGACFEIHFEKYRGEPNADIRPIEAKLNTDSSGRQAWTWRSVDDSTFDRVVKLSGDGLKPGEIADELGVNKSTVSRHLSRARLEGRISGSGK